MPTESGPRLGASALAALRTATSPLHEVLDSALPLSRPDAALSDYIEHLQHLRLWLSSYVAAEISLAGAGTVDAAAEERLARRRALLARIDADLTDVDPDVAGRAPRSSPRAMKVAAPWESSIPVPMHDAAYRWGVDYVIEGSQLGGTVLYRRLVERLRPHPLTYLLGDGADTGPRWRRFMANLENAVSSPADIDTACRGAVDAFSGLMRSFGLRSGAAVTRSLA